MKGGNNMIKSKLLDKNELKKIILYKLKNQKYKELLNGVEENE